MSEQLTVGKLIEQLAKFDKDTPVSVIGCDRCSAIHPVTKAVHSSSSEMLPMWWDCNWVVICHSDEHD